MSTSTIEVAIVGATGQTGSTIANALLESTTPQYVSTLYALYLQDANKTHLETHGLNEGILSAEAGSSRPRK